MRIEASNIWARRVTEPPELEMEIVLEFEGDDGDTHEVVARIERTALFVFLAGTRQLCCDDWFLFALDTATEN